MRDSALKRFLVGGYFNAVEVRDAARGMFAPPRFGGAAADYDAYWAERGPGRQQPRFEIIARGIQPGARVLDVGCGDGAMLEYLAETRRIAGIGLDISSRAVARARERGLDARVGTLDGASGGEFSDGFEHVVLSEVVEHVADAETFVQAGWRLAQRTLWLTFPNIGYFPHRLRLLSGRFPVQWVVFPSEHLRFWTIPDFRDWLRGLSLPAATFLPSNGLTIVRLHRLWPNLFANQIVVRIDRPSGLR